MKTSFLLLFICLASFVFCQSDTTKFKTFKIGKCKASLSGKYYDSCVVTISELSKLVIDANGCGDSAKVLSFDVTIGYNGIFQTMSASGDSLPGRLFPILRNDKTTNLVLLQNIKCLLPNGTIKILPGFTIRVLK